ncbi:hypothetical protein HN748_02060 [Candidatus Peregrinibacteria bacterium]|jgi:hypothetical protein|nr:hypothetical protein [Candidatus Peregrinibacteria bacterium]MBT7483244.1 hypothetical protein [Candidatus Peregrinibacteria bacterium]MBT7702993.1 hypothetical protein [Candidatus Peregrinibacteria bacterium]
MNNLNPLYDPATDDAPIDDKVQERLNEPLADPTGFDAGDEAFLQEVMDKFRDETIRPHEPSSLLNESVYDTLDDAKKGKADQNAFNILTSLRNIHELWEANPSPTYQIKTEIHRIRFTKERIEEELGDVYII